MKRVLLASTVLCLGGCGLFDFGDIDDSSADDDYHTYTPIDPSGNDVETADECTCAPDNAGIYVLSDTGEVWTFAPDTGDFNYLASIDCGGNVDVFSMAVSRKGRAWVQYFDGDVYTVDLKNPDIACLDPGYTDHEDPLFCNAGMAFVANSADDPCDRLYLHSALDYSEHGALGVLDRDDLGLTRLAFIDSIDGELTGTPDGRLFAIQRDWSPPRLTEYDKATGDILQDWSMGGLRDVLPLAFAAWGGRFYFFVVDDTDSTYSKVIEFDLETLRHDTVVERAPIRIYGAGVSSCAPAKCADGGRATCTPQ